MFKKHYTLGVATSKRLPSADWIVAVRKNVAKLSQLEFAARIGANRVTVTNWESGRFVPEWDSVEKIMRVFPAAPPPPFAKHSNASVVSNTGVKMHPIVEALGGALERQAKRLDGEQVIRAQKRVAEFAPRLTAGLIDEDGADQLLAILLADILGVRSR